MLPGLDRPVLWCESRKGTSHNMIHTVSILTSTKKDKFFSAIKSKVDKKDYDSFAKFAKNQIGNKDSELMNLSETEEVLERIVTIFSGVKIPANMSFNGLLNEFKKWHASNRQGVKRLGKSEEVEHNSSEEDERINVTATETGGMTLQEIANKLDSNRTITPTAVNQLLNKLIPSEGERTKLSVLKDVIKNESFMKQLDENIKRKSYQAAVAFVELFEQARNKDANQETVTLENLRQILSEAKLDEGMDDYDIRRENMLLERIVAWANDVDLADDDDWKDMAMSALLSDYHSKPSAMFKQSNLLDLPRHELNICKTYQNMVANLINPPPRRGRPPKAK